MKLPDCDIQEALRDQVARAFSARRSLHIEGSGSKAFYGRGCTAQPLSVSAHSGILEYEASELVLTARSGTPLNLIEQLLAEHGQMLAFEPPHFGAGATLGGTLACGLSGPRRPWAGAARDFVLGVGLINGKGETLSFGGRVIKNVAGYDLSRLMAGALGTLGVMTEISLKVLPLPETETTLAFELDAEQALQHCSNWSRKPLPLSAACHLNGRLTLRLSGSEAGVRQACGQLGGERLADGDAFWSSIREHSHPFFRSDQPLWRISVPPAAASLPIAGDWLLDWGGAQRWLYTDADPDAVRAAAQAAGGHATLFRGGDRSADVFHPLTPALLALHRRLKQALDPAGTLNPGRLYEGM